MKYLMVVLVTLWITIGYAQGPNILWTQQLGGFFGDEGYAIQQTSDSCYIVTGMSNYYGIWSYEVYLAKLSSNGYVLWENFLGDPGTKDEGFDVKQTNDRGYIVVGASDETVYLIKTDSLGNTMWSKTYDYEWGGEGRSVQQTNDGGYIVTGWTRSLSSDIQVYLVKTDSLGRLLWEKNYGEQYKDFGSSVQQTYDNGFIITGWSQRASNGNDDYYLIKTDASGNMLWTKFYGDDTTQDRAYSIIVTSDSGYIISGYGNLWNTWLMKTNSNGDSLWTKTYEPFCPTIQEIPGGNGYIVGGTIENDMCLIRTNNEGELLWTKAYGTPGLDYGNSAAATSDGGYILVGKTFRGSSNGFPDIYIIKTEPDLNGTEEQKAVKYNPASLTVSPNPSYGRCRINYIVPRAVKLYVEITDVLGRVVKKYDCNSGKLKDILIWNGDDHTGRKLPSGIYFITLQAGYYRETKKILMLK